MIVRTLILLLHLIELAARDAIEEVLKVRLPAILVYITKALICTPRLVVSLAALVVAKHRICETDLLKLEGSVCLDLLARVGVLVRMVYKREAAI